jgi:acetyl esterase/lipase
MNEKHIRALSRMLAFLSAGMGSLLLFRVRSPAGRLLYLPKMVASSLAPFAAVMGALGAALGLLSRARLALIAGAAGATLAARYVRRVTAPHDGFERAFGTDWQRRIPPGQASRMRKRRWTWVVSRPPEPRWERDLLFWTVPASTRLSTGALAAPNAGDSDRHLLCDIWQPPADGPRSGLGFVYIHGGGWYCMDKDLGTRPFFRHLAAQGHVVMDVAYRLCPETDVYGMVGDVKRAVAWMKANAGDYGVDPERVVVAGGSAGGHLALLAAYVPDDPRLTPDELRGAELSVRAVVSYYGAVDMRATYEKVTSIQDSRWKMSQIADAVQRTAEVMARYYVNGGRERANEGAGSTVFERLVDSSAQSHSYPEIMACLLGGQPDEVPEVYDLASPITHVSPTCPPTLLFQGTHDWHMPLSAARALYRKLVDAGVPVVYVEFPQTDHAFDLVALPRLSPSVQSALYDVDRFLALMV